MSTEPNLSSSTTGADAIDVAIAQGIDFDGSAIPPAKLDLYTQVMGLEAGRQREWQSRQSQLPWGDRHINGISSGSAG